MLTIPSLRRRAAAAALIFAVALSCHAAVAAEGEPRSPQELFAAAREAAAAGDDGRALELLAAVVEAGGKPYVPTLRAAEFERLRDDERFRALVERMRPCTEPERRQFDFWIGDWDVANPQGTVLGRNVIEAAEGGCALRESYAAGPYTGTSLNFWNAGPKLWHQTWIDNQGQPLDLDGGLVDGSMVLTGGAGGALQRITWTPLPDGRVRQHWESSSDDGATWSTAFDGYYTRRP